MLSAVKRVGMLMYDKSDLLDLAGPTAAFHSAARHLVADGRASELLYVVEPISIDGGPVRTLQNIVVDTQPAPDLRGGEYDTLMVVGGHVDHTDCDPRILDWIARSAPHVRRLASVCCGAFLLGGAGLLDGRRATTHWQDCERLRAAFPLAEVEPDAIFIQDGELWTAAGITAGIDLGMAMVEDDHGERLSLAVARNLVVFLKRPGGQSQFSAMLQSQSTEGPMRTLLDWIVDHPQGDLRAEALADRANMSLRNFYRAFEAATGASPASWVEMARVENAKRLLSQGAEQIEQVAYGSGFASYDAMRKAFARRLHVTPSAYRERFAPRRPGAAMQAAE